MEFKPSRFTIRVKLLVIISGILVAALTGMILLATEHFKNDSETRIQEHNLRLTRVIGARVRLELQNVIYRTSILLSGRSSAGAFTAVGNENLIFAGIAEKASGGGLRFRKVLFNDSFLNENKIKREDVRKANESAARNFLNSFNGAVLVRNVSPGFKLPVLGISLPLKGFEGRRIMVILIESRGFLRAFPAGGTTRTFLVNFQGDVLAHPDSKLVLTRTNMAETPIVQAMMRSKTDNRQLRYQDAQGVHHLGFFQKLGVYGLGVIATVAEKRAFEAVYGIQRRNIYIMLIFLNLAILIVFFFSRRITEPIHRLVEAAHTVEKGDYRIDIEPASGDEIGMLTNSFIAMTRGLEQTEAMIHYQAFHDSLTGLANRALLMERLKLELAHARRDKTTLAVFFLDLDRFKTINDTLGHSAGDWLLKQVAILLNNCLRNSDTVARQGGDEFIIILPDVDHGGGASAVANKILQKFESPFVYESHELRVSCSIGIALYPENGETSDTLLKNADAAMYSVKNKGRKGFRFYSSARDSQSVERLRLEGRLYRALENEEFLLHYQPRVELESGRVCGLEALVRWKHPERGMVPPVEFIPLAEETGLILQIGEWVLKKACLDHRILREEGFEKLVTAVNFSPRQFQQPDLMLRVRDVLEETEMSPERLEIEITEGTLMDDPNAAQDILSRLNKLGVQTSIDDFGTGYSSLAYLKRFPIDILKIDRTFVNGIPGEADDVAIIGAIIALARSLNLMLIAEGVETEEQSSYLKSVNCDQVQGYYFCRPLPMEELLPVLRNWGKERRKSG